MQARGRVSNNSMSRIQTDEAMGVSRRVPMNRLDRLSVLFAPPQVSPLPTVMSSSLDPFTTVTGTNDGFVTQGTIYSPDFLTLRRAWINEKNAPELLEYESHAVDSIMRGLREQWAVIDARQRQWAASNPMMRDLFVMEADRVGYILKSYLRERLMKIQKFARFYLLHHGSSPTLLSPAELQFAANIVGITDKAFTEMFLRGLPQEDDYFQTLVASDDPGGDMVRRPDLEKVVFVHVNEHAGTITTGPDETATLEKDHTYMIRYDLVRDILRSGGRINLV
jgi:GINS complex subunit 4